uniref:Uncharacterized protein n=1 Tax=Romanomermis culicivorax TaxID=13658 RepID=A0A915LED1_ROMCU
MPKYQFNKFFSWCNTFRISSKIWARPNDLWVCKSGFIDPRMMNLFHYLINENRAMIESWNFTNKQSPNLTLEAFLSFILSLQLLKMRSFHRDEDGTNCAFDVCENRLYEVMAPGGAILWSRSKSSLWYIKVIDDTPSVLLIDSNSLMMIELSTKTMRVEETGNCRNTTSLKLTSYQNGTNCFALSVEDDGYPFKGSMQRLPITARGTTKSLAPIHSAGNNTSTAKPALLTSVNMGKHSVENVSKGIILMTIGENTAIQYENEDATVSFIF